MGSLWITIVTYVIFFYYYKLLLQLHIPMVGLYFALIFTLKCRMTPNAM